MTMEGIMIEFYNNKFREIRKSNGMPLNILAQKTDVTRVTLWRWESGRGIPSETQIRLLAKILNVSVTEFSNLKREEEVSDIHLSQLSKAWSSLADVSGREVINESKMLVDTIRQRYSKLEQVSIIAKAIMSSISSVFYVKDTDLKYITANRAFLEILSLKPSFSVLGKTDEDFFPAQEAKKNSKEDYNVLLTGESIELEKNIPGTRKKKWGIVNKSLIMDNDGKIVGLVGTFLDITEKRKEEKMRIQMEFFLNAMPDTAFYIAKWEKSIGQENVLFVSDGIEQITGIKKEDVDKYDKIFNKKLFHPDFHFLLDEDYWKNIEYPHEYEFKIIRPDGEERWIKEKDFYDKKETYFGTLTDITSIKESKTTNK